MLSFEKCKKILISHGRNYTDEEVGIIVNFLKQLALVEYKQYKSQRRENEKGHHLHSGKHRRTSR